MKYQVTVGNIGTVLNTDSEIEAINCFNEYLFQSQSGYGSASGESVCIMEDDEPLEKFDFSGENFPMIEEVEKLLLSFIEEIDDECRASDEDETPGIQITIATNDGQDFVWQSGDNSYTGSCYHCQHWSVIYLYPDSDCKALAIDAVNELFELIAGQLY